MAGDIIMRMTEYEQGTLSKEDTLDLFADLLNTGVLWQIKANAEYGRKASYLIESGLLDSQQHKRC